MLSNYDIWRMYNNLKGNHWKAYQADCRKNGYLCAECHGRFSASKRAPSVVCLDCAAKMIDRLEEDKPTHRHYVYALFNDDGMVYIGVTNNPAQRLQAHLADKYVTRMSIVKGFNDRTKAEAFEKFCIEEFAPVLNVRITPTNRPLPHQWRDAFELLIAEVEYAEFQTSH